GMEKITYLHPKLEPILKNTYGIGVYQEQMMKIAQELAGFTLAEADILRKAIGKKIKALLDSQKEKLLEGMKKNNIDEKTANAVWELFPSFARYGFNRSHAVCYAMIGYQTAYLKTHYPIEFTTSLFNADSGDIERISFLMEESKKLGVLTLPPDINKSFVNFVAEDNNIRFGLLAVKNVGAAIVEAIINERLKGGPFQNFTDFLNRVNHKDLNKKSLESLAKAGIFDSLDVERGMILANIENILSFSQNIKKSLLSNQNNLFGSGFINNSLKLNSAPPASNREKLVWEKELVGLYISAHPLKEYTDRLRISKVKPIKEIKNMADKKLFGLMGARKEVGGAYRIAGVITKIQKIVTKNGQPMIFMRVEDLNDAMEVIVFTDMLSKNPALWQENKVLIIEGRLSWKDDDPKLICQSAIEL
ncbi:MAG: OB-fold nucleic acid binding domain-containing protein, partial [Patescibacteria group bacterium]